MTRRSASASQKSSNERRLSDDVRRKRIGEGSKNSSDWPLKNGNVKKSSCPLRKGSVKMKNVGEGSKSVSGRVRSGDVEMSQKSVVAVIARRDVGVMSLRSVVDATRRIVDCRRPRTGDAEILRSDTANQRRNAAKNLLNDDSGSLKSANGGSMRTDVERNVRSSAARKRKTDKDATTSARNDNEKKKRDDV